MRSGFGIRAAVLLIGSTAAASQIVLLRELMVVFYGNEISIGLMLASWLLWTAAGSSLAGRIAAPNPRRLMALLQVLVAAVLPATVLAVRAARGLLETVPGEVLGPGSMLLTTLVALGPLCVLSGALFTTAGRSYAAETSVTAGQATGSVYLWEAAGSSAGGLAAGLALAPLLGALEIACLLAVVNLVAACGLAIARRPLRHAAIAILAAITLLVEIAGVPRRVEQISQAHFWRGQHLIATRNSLYGNLAVTGGEGSRTVYENGVVLFNVPDPPAAEEAVHYALLEHPAPRTLLLIGGGLDGSISQALLHPSLERVDYVELDPAILDLARQYFPDEWRALERDPRVRVHIADGRLYVKNTRSAFDVIVVNLPDPRNAQLNRFYTAEFFREAARALTPTGLLSFQVKSSENYISPELGQFLRTIYTTLRLVFPEVAFIPGETVHFFAARRPGILASGAPELLSRLHARGLETEYVSRYFIPFRMAPDRMLDLRKHLEGPGSAPLNRDFAPVAYYFDVALWSSQFHQAYRRLFRALSGVPFSVIAAALGMLLAALVLAARFSGQRRRLAAGFCTAATGFNMIGLEILLLLGFQAVYGYVYQQLAALIAAFMAGMALGSWLALRSRRPAGMRLLGITQMLVAAAPLVLTLWFEVMAAPPAVFWAAALGCGILGGFQFPLAGRIYFSGAAPTKNLGALYALDLAGSCLAAILFSAWLIPVFGFSKTAIFAAIVSLAPAAMALSARSPD